MTDTEVAEQARQRRGIWITVAALVVVISVIVGGFVRQFIGPQPIDPKWLEAHSTYLFDKPRVFDPVSLINKDGDTYTGADFEGAWNFVFFGFTYCPDICPTTMAQLGSVYKQLSDSAAALPVRVHLVTVDPARDTPQLLKGYVEHFNADFNALTGDFLDIHRFATQLNTPFRKVIDQNDPDTYTVDHSGNIVIINPKGHYAGFIRAPFDNEKLLRVIERVRLQPY